MRYVVFIQFYNFIFEKTIIGHISLLKHNLSKSSELVRCGFFKDLGKTNISSQFIINTEILEIKYTIAGLFNCPEVLLLRILEL